MKNLLAFCLLHVLLSIYASWRDQADIGADTYYLIAWMLFSTAVIASEIRKVRP